MTKDKKEQIISENYDNVYRLANSLCKAYGLPSDVFEDLQKAGYISLLSQADSFDESKGVAFWTYAYKGVRNKMLEEIRFCIDTVSISEHLNKQLTKVRSLVTPNSDKNTQQLISLISEAMNVSSDKAEEFLILSRKDKTSIDEYSEKHDEEGICNCELGKRLGTDESNPEEVLLQKEKLKDNAAVCALIDEILPVRQAEYIKLYYGIGCKPQTLEEIGEEFCVSSSAVDKGIKRALERLRGEMGEVGIDLL